MDLRTALAGGSLALSLVVAAPASDAQAQRTNFQGINECSRLGAVQFHRRDPGFRRFVIDRASVTEDRHSAMVGSQYISTVYSGTATYDGGAGARKVLFVCLHGGTERGAVFVYTVPQ